MDSEFRILDWQVTPNSNTLTSTDKSVHIEPKVMAVLTFLAEHAGEVVPKNEIIQGVWEEKFISDEVLTVAIHELRKALGDKAKAPRYIKTIPKTGYRLIAPVEPVTVSVDQFAQTPSQDNESGWTQGRLVRFAAAGVSLLLLALAIALVLAVSRGSLKGEPHDTQIKSLAVLPLENLSGDPDQGFFADGVTEALITDLAKRGQVHIISRTSTMAYKNTGKPISEIARALHVDAAVEGTVLLLGDRVRVTVQLVDANTGRHLWTEKYESPLTGVIALQTEIATAISTQLARGSDLKAPSQVAPVPAVDPETYEAYLRGRYFWNQRSEEATRKAVGYFQKAIAKSPDYAPAYAGLADCYTFSDGGMMGLSWHEASREATAIVGKALELDSTLAEAHTSLGAIRLHDRDWEGAEAELKRGVELNSNSAIGFQWYGELLSALGRHDEAILAMDRAQRLDPLEITINGDLAWIYFMARKYELALGQIQKTLELNESVAWMYDLMGVTHQMNGQPAEATQAFKKAMVLTGIRPEQMKDVTDIESLYQWWLRRPKKSNDYFPLTRIYVALGKTDKALERLEKALNRDYSMLWLNVNPVFDSLRADPRFIDLLRRYGFES